MGDDMTKPTTLTIVRETWVRGNAHESSLLTSDGRRCCLGFYGRACGFADDEMFQEGEPAHLWRTMPAMSYAPVSDDDDASLCNTDLANCLISINDSRCLSDAERERQVRAEFATIGVAVSFVDREDPQ